jgi:hypothetical protein
MSAPRVPFLSLFVEDPTAAAVRLEALLGCRPRSAGDAGANVAPSPHPFAAEGPIVFELGTIELALYRASAAKGTHGGDVGIGIALGALEEDDATLDARLAASQARPLAPTTTLADGRSLRVAMTLDRHFFELIRQT